MPERTRRGKRVVEVKRTFDIASPIPVGDTPRSLVGPGECALYRFYDERGDLLYVGVSWNPGRRWQKHRDKSWWSKVTKAIVVVYSCEADALEAERAWIRNARPTHNVRSAA